MAQYQPSLSDENIKRLKDPSVIIGSVVQEIGESETVLNAWKDKIVKYYELYKMVQRKKNYEGLASIFVPETLRAVETIVAKLYQIIVGQPDWFEYSGRDGNGDDGPALAMTQLVKYQMDENGFKSKLMDTLRQMVITGLCVRKILWDYQVVQRKTREKGGNVKTVPDTIKDVWTFEAVDLLSFHISDINVPYHNIQQARWIAEQSVVSKQYIEERCRKGWFSKAMESEIEDTVQANASQASAHSDKRLETSGFQQPSKKGKYELIERWGLVQAGWVLTDEEMKEEGFDSDDMIEGVIVIANRRAILKLERNPFYHNSKPYVSCPYVPKENELPGIGAVQIAETLQEEINDTRNQTMDNKTLVLMTMWLKTRGSGIKNADLRIRANGVVTTNDINGLVPLRPPIVAGVGTNMEGVSKEDLRQSVGAASNLQGIAQAGVGTATESSIVNKESMGRLLLTAELFGELILKPTFIFAEYLNYQFYDHVKSIKILGPVGVKMRKLEPDEIAGYKNVVIKLSTDASENPSVMRQQLMNFMTIVQTLPPQVLEFHWKLLDKIYSSFFNGHSLSELYPGGPVDPESLLSPEDERDMVLAEQVVLAQKGQDHKAALEFHIPEFKSMQYGLNDMQFGIYQKLIQSHVMALQAEADEQQDQFIAQTMMAEQGRAGKGGPNTGQIPGASAHTQTDAPSTQSLRKGIGG